MNPRIPGTDSRSKGQQTEFWRCTTDSATGRGWGRRCHRRRTDRYTFAVACGARFTLPKLDKVRTRKVRRARKPNGTGTAARRARTLRGRRRRGCGKYRHTLTRAVVGAHLALSCQHRHLCSVAYAGSRAWQRWERRDAGTAARRARTLRGRRRRGCGKYRHTLTRAVVGAQLALSRDNRAGRAERARNGNHARARAGHAAALSRWALQGANLARRRALRAWSACLIGALVCCGVEAFACGRGRRANGHAALIRRGTGLRRRTCLCRALHGARVEAGAARRW
jgi:hypothetical protein